MIPERKKSIQLSVSEKDLLASSAAKRKASGVHSRQDEVALHQRGLAHDAPHVRCEGLGAVHQLHNLQGLQLGHPTQERTQQGL